MLDSTLRPRAAGRSVSSPGFPASTLVLFLLPLAPGLVNGRHFAPRTVRASPHRQPLIVTSPFSSSTPTVPLAKAVPPPPLPLSPTSVVRRRPPSVGSAASRWAEVLESAELSMVEMTRVHGRDCEDFREESEERQLRRFEFEPSLVGNDSF
ncbi:hypothetical protein T484DRAFT_1915147 [Baffinella frigidus]|nr:hypothetical protein T484DRAFT_1915147 [Cryptophyta sp. CCMP2293]